MKPGLMISLMSMAVIGSGGTSAMTVSSDSFRNGEYLSKEFSCEGEDRSPDIRWTYSGSAESFALICEDPDAPGGSFVHWVIYSIPGDVRELKKAFPAFPLKDGIFQGINDFSTAGYKGPCPPKGKAHRYIFTVYALDIKPEQPELTAESLKSLIQGHTLISASITGMYKR